jgi:hypothetical protein
MSTWAEKFGQNASRGGNYSLEENTLHLFHIQFMRLGALALMGKRASTVEPLLQIAYYFSQQINQHYQPAVTGEPCVIFQGDNDEIHTSDSLAPVELSRADKQYLGQLFSCLYVEAVDENGAAHYAYIGIAADHLDEMLTHLHQHSHLNPSDYHGVVFWHDAEPPVEDVRSLMLGRFDFADLYISLRLPDASDAQS